MPTTRIKGKITDIFPGEIFGNNFEKRVFWVEELNSKYPNTWQLELHQGKCNELDYYKVGQIVDCEVEVNGRKWVKGDKTYMFTTLKVLQMMLAQESKAPPGQPVIPPHYTQQSPSAKTVNQTEVNTGTPLPKEPETVSDNPEDDLPF